MNLKRNMMVDEYGISHSYRDVLIKTAFGSTEEGRLVCGLDTCFFKTPHGGWLNYEPHQIESYEYLNTTQDERDKL